MKRAFTDSGGSVAVCAGMTLRCPSNTCMRKEGAAVASGSAYHRKSRIQPIVAALPAASQSEGSRILRCC
jgi:hypothetical protein